MKPETSGSDSFFDMELSSAQKAALEKVLFSNESNPLTEQRQPPPPPVPTPAPPPPQQQYNQPSQKQQPVDPNEPQVLTIDMTHRPGYASGQSREQQSRSQRSSGRQGGNSQQRRPRSYSDDSEPQWHPDAKVRSRSRSGKGGGITKSGIKTILLVLVLFFGAIGIWYYACVMDTSPPTADPLDRAIMIGESVKPEDFVVNIYDDSEIVSIEFVEEPNLEARNDQIVRVRITDEHGNAAIFEATLTIKLNQTPPVIEGTGTIYSTVGNPIIYRQGVTAHDDFGRELELHVDSDTVRQHEVGEYTIRFWATDLTGNTSEVFQQVIIVSVDVAFVFSEADKILSEILNDGNTQLEKVKAIHAWIRNPNNMQYASVVGGGTDSVYEQAFRALSDRRGNCFVYYAIGEVLLTRAGIENMAIDRIPGTPTKHRWSLVNPDNLGWHHFDTTPTRLQLGSETAFFTNTQAKEFTNRFIEFNGTRDFYTFNAELYPTIVE